MLLWTTKTTTTLLIPNIWALDKSSRLKSFLCIFFLLIIVRTKKIELLIFCHNTLNGMLKMKLSYKSKTWKSCISNNLLWIEFLVFQQKSSPFFIRFSSVWPLFYSRYDNSLANYFGINKTQELKAKKYYWPILFCNVKAYIKDCDIYLTSKTVCHKLYSELLALPIPTHCLKDLSIYFVRDLIISINWKANYYNFILVIINSFTKIISYKLVKVTTNIAELVKVIIAMLMKYHSLPKSIINDQGLIFIFKF